MRATDEAGSAMRPSEVPRLHELVLGTPGLTWEAALSAGARLLFADDTDGRTIAVEGASDVAGLLGEVCTCANAAARSGLAIEETPFGRRIVFHVGRLPTISVELGQAGKHFGTVLIHLEEEGDETLRFQVRSLLIERARKLNAMSRPPSPDGTMPFVEQVDLVSGGQ